MAMITKIMIILSICKISYAIIGFDCGLTDPIITTYSLLDSGDCDFQQKNINITNTTIQLLQIAEFRSIKVIQCKVEIKRTIYNCGMFSHLGPVEQGVQEYLYDISHENCKSLHETGIFKYDNFHTIADLKINSSKTTGVEFAGSVKEKHCSGASYSDHYGSWSDVLVQGLIKITLLEEYAEVSMNNDKIRLNSGTVCKFSDEHCIDFQAGHTFWSIIINNDCMYKNYDILYKGLATKISSENNNIVYSISTNEISFALSAKENINYCNRILTITEHPKLCIYDQNNNNIFLDNEMRYKQVLNLDFFTYMNSKFVYIEKHFRVQFENLYLNILKEKCELEKKVIQNSLSIASISPDEFAYNLMENPGYIARLAGEVVHIIKCTPTEVRIQHVQNCYMQLPVISGNKTMFLTPKTHILINNGLQIDCNTIIPQYYKIGENWINLLPTPRKSNNIIEIIKPSTKILWNPEKLKSLATSGIYSQEDLQRLQRHIMFPMERTSLLNTIARGMEGEENVQGGLIYNLFTEKTLSNIAENTWNKVVEKFIKFGSISSAIIMIFVILHIFKLTIDIVIRGYTLHAIYGWSIHLIAAIFGSLTHLFTVLQESNNNKKSSNKSPLYEETELTEVKILPTISLPIKPPPLPKKPPNSSSLSIQKNCSNNIFSLNH